MIEEIKGFKIYTIAQYGKLRYVVMRGTTWYALPDLILLTKTCSASGLGWAKSKFEKNLKWFEMTQVLVGKRKFNVVSDAGVRHLCSSLDKEILEILDDIEKENFGKCEESDIGMGEQEWTVKVEDTGDGVGMSCFTHKLFGDVRIIIEGGKELFCGYDIAKALGYSRQRDAISRHCKGAVKRGGVCKTVNQYGVETFQTNVMSFIPEGDVYRLIIRSELPSAEKFEIWLFDEVLPMMRKTGGYVVENKEEKFVDEYFTASDPAAKAALVASLKATRVEREKNAVLGKQNELLAVENSTWEDRQVVTTLMPFIAKRAGITIGKAYNEFYKALDKRYRIDLPRRMMSYGGKEKRSIIDFTKENEWDYLVRVAAAIATNLKVDFVNALGMINCKRAEEAMNDYSSEDGTLPVQEPNSEFAL